MDSAGSRRRYISNDAYGTPSVPLPPLAAAATRSDAESVFSCIVEV